MHGFVFVGLSYLESHQMSKQQSGDIYKCLNFNEQNKQHCFSLENKIDARLLTFVCVKCGLYDEKVSIEMTIYRYLIYIDWLLLFSFFLGSFSLFFHLASFDLFMCEAHILIESIGSSLLFLLLFFGSCL